jgi:hypothetical protein
VTHSVIGGNSLMVVIAALSLAGCDTLSTSLLGAGASAGMQAGISNAMSGTLSRTFTASLPVVRSAALTPLQHMQMDVRSTNKLEGGEDVRATSGSRDIDIELEEISPNATRMSVTVKSTRSEVLPFDNATSAEILRQSQRAILPLECVPAWQQSTASE